MMIRRYLILLFLGGLLLSPLYAEPEEPKVPFDVLLGMAQEGMRHAQFDLGVRYYIGDGVTKDPKKAYDWFVKAAEQNDEEALYNLGTMALKGDGTPRHFQHAYQWFSKCRDITQDPLRKKHLQLVLKQLDSIRQVPINPAPQGAFVR